MIQQIQIPAVWRTFFLSGAALLLACFSGNSVNPQFEFFRKNFDKNFEKKDAVLPGDTLLEATICAGETYFFAGEALFETGIYEQILTASDGSDSLVTLELTVLEEIITFADAQICEGENFTFNGANYSETGVYIDTLTAASGCDSLDVLSLNVLTAPKTNFKIRQCEGTSYVFAGDTLTTDGIYSDTLRAVNGCDSVITLDLDFLDFFLTKIEATICSGETYIFGGDTLDFGGVYTDSLVAVGGCDSVVMLVLTVDLPVVYELEETICAGETIVFGSDTLDVSGNYSMILPGANTCDTTINLALTVLPKITTEFSETLCFGETYTFGGQEQDVSGTYTEVLTSETGCDSTVILQLTILPELIENISATICDGETYEFDGFELDQSGDYIATTTSTDGCDSTINLNLEVLPAAATEISTTICDNEILPFFGQILFETGTYTAVLTAANGCDSVLTLNLEVLPTVETEFEATICAGESVVFNGQTLTDEGDYSAVLTSENGCDSTVVLVLTVLPTAETELEATLCAGETIEFDGETISDAGEYTAVLTSENGCDSTVVLTVNVLPTAATVISATICSSQTYDFQGQNLDQAGVFTAILESENGCDSTVTLTLEVLPSFETELAATICSNEPLAFFGQILNQTGVFTATLPAANGCDSVLTLNLTVLHAPATQVSETICAGETFNFNGQDFSSTGNFTFDFTAANGCDSTATLNLTVLPKIESSVAASICSGTSYFFDGQNLADAGNYSAVFAAANGCDSTVNLNLTVVAGFETSLAASICAGETFSFGGENLSTAGVFSDTLTAAGGCDSVLVLTLTVLENTASQSVATICAGETFNFNGQNLTTAGSYSAVLQNSNGCDSTATLVLTVLPTASTTINATACAGEVVPFFGIVLTQSGSYTAKLTAANGCDSTITLNLTVLPTAATSLSRTICAGDNFDFNGQNLSATGVYTAKLAGENGCDSTVTLNLTVLPTSAGSQNVSTCATSYQFAGQNLTSSGTYTFEFQGQNGCDSIFTLNLTLLATPAPTELSASICEGENYPFNGATLSASGTYTATLTAANGCDSLVRLELRVRPKIIAQFSRSICEGDTLLFNGQILTAAGTFTAILTGSNGCDSTVILTLGVKTVDNSVVLNNGTLTATAASATFQWFDCSNFQIIAGATAASFTPTKTGNYGCIVTQNGCTKWTQCLLVEVSSADEPFAAGNWMLLPNPTASDEIWISFEKTLERPLVATIFDATGRQMRRAELSAGIERTRLDLQDLPQGIYHLRLSGATNAGSISSKRFIKI